MTTEERISMITAKRNQLDNAENAKKTAENQMRESLKNEIYSMRERIENVISIGNALNANGFLRTKGFKSDDNRLKPYGYDGSVIAEGICHHVGFMETDNKSFKFLGIDMGGACGVYDFITDGRIIVSVHESTGKHNPIVPIAHLKKFLAEFPKFESALYAWIDSEMAL